MTQKKDVNSEDINEHEVIDDSMDYLQRCQPRRQIQELLQPFE